MKKRKLTVLLLACLLVLSGCSSSPQSTASSSTQSADEHNLKDELQGSWYRYDEHQLGFHYLNIEGKNVEYSFISDVDDGDNLSSGHTIYITEKDTVLITDKLNDSIHKINIESDDESITMFPSFDDRYVSEKWYAYNENEKLSKIADVGQYVGVTSITDQEADNFDVSLKEAEYIDDGLVRFSGSITNNNEQEFDNIRIMVNVRDDEGKIADQVKFYVNDFEPIKPGETVNFSETMRITIPSGNLAGNVTEALAEEDYGVLE